MLVQVSPDKVSAALSHTFVHVVVTVHVPLELATPDAHEYDPFTFLRHEAPYASYPSGHFSVLVPEHLHVAILIVYL